MSKAQLTSIYILLLIQHLIFVISLMQIGWGVQPHGNPSLNTVRFLEEILSPGVQKNNIQFLGLAPKRNIEPWQIQQLNSHGCHLFFKIFTFHWHLHQLSTVITQVFLT